MTEAKNEDLFERVRLVFGDALSVPFDERTTFLNDVCAGDHELLREVTELLQYHESTPEALDSPLVPRIGGEILTGVQLGHYLLDESLGEGGMGVVYRARDDRNGDLVAIKVLRSDLSSQTAATRFRLESHTLKRLEGEGIARFLESGTATYKDRELSYYAMELIEGRDLRDTNIGTVQDAVALLAKICDAIGIAHDHEIIHRDVKPENIIVREDGRPVVLDFGISRTVDPDGRTTSFVTSTGHVLGTVCYMSPEQLIGDSSATGPHSDVYSLGVLAYELLTGSRPHESKMTEDRTTLTQAGVLLAIEKRDAPLASTRRQGLDPALDAILYKALQRRPHERYVHATAMAEDLRAYLAGEKVSAPRQTLLRRGWNRARRAPRRTILVATTAFAIILTAGGITKTLQDRQEERLVQSKLSEVWSILQDVNQDLHLSGNRTEESILRAIDNLDQSREILRTMPHRPFWPRLRRFVDWRSGEARFFLGARNRDATQFHLAFGHWTDAHAFTDGTENTLEGLDRTSSLYGDIAGITIPVVIGGRGLACASIAQYEDRAEYLRQAVSWREHAFTLLESDTDWGLGDLGPDVRSMSILDYAGVLIAYGTAVDSLKFVDEGTTLMKRVDNENLWINQRSAFAAGQHRLGQAAFYRWDLSGDPSDLIESEQRFRRSLGIRGEGSGSSLHVWDRMALATLRLWEGRRASSGEIAHERFQLARKELAPVRGRRDPEQSKFTVAWIDILDAEITAALVSSEVGQSSSGKRSAARAESLLTVAEGVFPRSRFPLQNAELQLARIHVLEALESVRGPRHDKIEQALTAIEVILPGGIWPRLRRRAEAHRP